MRWQRLRAGQPLREVRLHRKAREEGRRAEGGCRAGARARGEGEWSSPRRRHTFSLKRSPHVTSKSQQAYGLERWQGHWQRAGEGGGPRREVARGRGLVDHRNPGREIRWQGERGGAESGDREEGLATRRARAERREEGDKS